VPVVELSKFQQRGPQLGHVAEAPDPQKLFFQRAEEAFDASVTLRLPNERRRGLDSQEADFYLERQTGCR